jgi:type I restriction enzyme, S subunit
MSGVRIDDALPRGWSSLALADLCDVITDGTHYTPRYVTNGVPFFSVENVTANDFLNVKYITKSEHLKLIKRCRPQRGDILMTRIGSLADTKLIDWDVDASIYVSLALLRPGRSIDAGYLYAYTKSAKFVHDVEDRSLLWATPKKINMGDIGRVSVVFPLDRREQQSIANVFRDVEKYIVSLERLIAKKQSIKQGMMQQLLTGRTRLPSFTARWTTGPLKLFFPLQRGFDLPTSKVIPGRYPVVYSNGVARTHAVAMAKGPGVITGRSGTIGKVHYIEEDYWPHNTALWVTSFARADAKFAYYFLTHIGLERFSSGSGVPTLNRNDAHSFEVKLPSDTGEQRAIASVLTDADDEIDRLHALLAKATAIKQGMMQELLTGRTRLPVVEAVA